MFLHRSSCRECFVATTQLANGRDYGTRAAKAQLAYSRTADSRTVELRSSEKQASHGDGERWEGRKAAAGLQTALRFVEGVQLANSRTRELVDSGRSNLGARRAAIHGDGERWEGSSGAGT
ncbi:hypothetical protein CLOM_g22306 [Closterium sp. NIES-68]|nr:hypothetical protein CLOM_g22306 [Closterium sp. NIES-68]GJP64418.1 hypothetical protein CLOP_g21413 [Closterium sp. NIES-67]GJP80719.1 hypothetical protein CLOP_g10923 [Closterium sp. NIES-67]